MFYTSGAQGPKRSRVRDWRPCGQWKECPRKLMDPSTLHWACQATVPGKKQPISHVRGPPEWAPVGPLVCLVDRNFDCRPVSRCHSRRYSILWELRWYPACLAPCVTGKRKANQVPLDIKPVIGLQQSGSSAIQCLGDSDSPMPPCHLGCLSPSVYLGNKMAWADPPVAQSLYALVCTWFQPRCWRGANVMQRGATPWPWWMSA